MSLTIGPQRFSFRKRPIAVPGDLRIEWRVSIIVLMLGFSRSKQASLAKLHLLNDAVRAPKAAALLDLVVSSSPGRIPWTFRIEPAFGRAIDFVVGDGLAGWTTTADRSALQLSIKGVTLFESLKKEHDLLTSERDLLSKYAKSMTEAIVSAVIGAARRAT
ncbi:hypothetical protein [Bosea sp. (in: a-proteobacteria)]|uniref:hypothetical protein n=1 Tax=Bosea sp. (in: a-proteobacteria) TaxID=1871050 RepID=UPI002735B821|nr:hypothetical protein [Bosea sp. (in: a-proteobacteria)]MDP3410529.1 hypothetical protein [Bosea sp. (in: a-proteobacteria)]